MQHRAGEGVMRNLFEAWPMAIVLSLSLAAPVAAGTNVFGDTGFEPEPPPGFYPESPMEDGLIAYERGDYAAALRLWRPPADRGDAAAQYNLGVMYLNGQGVPQDYAAAATWYLKAADQGYAAAQGSLGVM